VRKRVAGPRVARNRSSARGHGEDDAPPNRARGALLLLSCARRRRGVLRLAATHADLVQGSRTGRRPVKRTLRGFDRFGGRNCAGARRQRLGSARACIPDSGGHHERSRMEVRVQRHPRGCGPRAVLHIRSRVCANVRDAGVARSEGEPRIAHPEHRRPAIPALSGRRDVAKHQRRSQCPGVREALGNRPRAVDHDHARSCRQRARLTRSRLERRELARGDGAIGASDPRAKNRGRALDRRGRAARAMPRRPDTNANGRGELLRRDRVNSRAGSGQAPERACRAATARSLRPSDLWEPRVRLFGRNHGSCGARAGGTPWGKRARAVARRPAHRVVAWRPE